MVTPRTPMPLPTTYTMLTIQHFLFLDTNIQLPSRHLDFSQILQSLNVQHYVSQLWLFQSPVFISLFTKSCQFCLKISLEVSIYIMSSATLIILFGSYSSLLPELCLWSPYSLHVFLYTYTATCRLIFLDLKSDFVIVLLIIL